MPATSPMTVRAYTLRLYPNPGKAKEAYGILIEQRAWLYEFVRQHMATGEETWTTSTKGLGTAANHALYRAKAIIKAGRNSSIATGQTFNTPRYLPLLSDGTVEPAHGTNFDYWVKMIPGPRMPAKSHTALNKALRAGGTLANTAQIAVDCKSRLIVRVFVRFTVPTVTETKDYIGVDVGVNHGLCTSEGYQGKSLKPFLEKTQLRNAERQRQGHLHKLQARRSACKQFLDREARRLVASAKRGQKTLVLESSKTLGNLHPTGPIGLWARQHVGRRVSYLAEVTGVAIREVWPGYTSITCRACGYVSNKNRSGVNFRCLQCEAIGHTDKIAAFNLRDRARGIWPMRSDTKAAIETRSPHRSSSSTSSGMEKSRASTLGSWRGS
jgi:Putative transposase DNA-binding domain